MNLIVKFGPYITIAEGQCLMVVKRYLQETVPVPEVYGWCKDGDDVFIYMQLIPGITLTERWGSLTVKEKDGISQELRVMMHRLRQLVQDPLECIVGKMLSALKKPELYPSVIKHLVLIFQVGSVGGQSINDETFRDREPGGPFKSVKDFHDWIIKVGSPPTTDLLPQDHPYRNWLPDDQPIVFTHADLHRGNIIVPAYGPVHVLAIIDWAQSGWYPAHWEFCKARHTTLIGEEWEKRCIPDILGSAYESLYWQWDFFLQRMGV
jgi:hypothetical protein